MLAKWYLKKKAELVENYANFFRDHKQQKATVMFIAGVSELVYALLIQERPPVVQILWHAIPQSFLIVTSNCLIWTGFCGMWWRKLDDRWMKKLDFAWILASALSVFLLLTRSFLLPADDYRKEHEQRLFNSRAMAALEIEKAMLTGCGPHPAYTFEFCRNMEFTYEQLRSNHNVDAFNVEKICPKPPLDSSKNPPPVGLFNACINLYMGAYHLNDDPIISDGENVKFFNISSVLFALLIAQVLGMRVAKSVSELWWMEPKNGTAGTTNSTPAQTGPTDIN